MKRILFILPTLFLISCQSNSNEKPFKGDVKALAEQKCSMCHNLDMPPKFSDNEKAPPFFTVTVHLKDWMKADTKSEQREKFIDFVSDYVINPTKEKSYCAKKTLNVYGIMPSQKGHVTKAEAKAIAAYMYDTYDEMELMKIMQERARIKALPPYKQVLELKDCKTCHIAGAGRLAPSFAEIGKKYGKKGANTIKNSILNGSSGKWSKYKISMHGYKDLTKEQLDGIVNYIIHGNSTLSSIKVTP